MIAFINLYKFAHSIYEIYRIGAFFKQRTTKEEFPQIWGKSLF